MGTVGHLELYLVRHGLTEWNLQKRYLGHTDLGLCSEHRHQLQALRSYFENQSISSICSSDLRRCIETARNLFPDQPIKTDVRLREIHFGEWEGKTYQELKDNLHYRRWLEDWENESIPGGESGKRFQARVYRFLQEYLDKEIDSEKAPRSVIVTHGGVIRRILSIFLPDRPFWEWSVSHGTGYVLRLEKEGGSWRCCSWSVVPTQESGNG